jgi:hypothetical protein
VKTKNAQRKKPLTLDDFAALIQTDLKRMATKDDLADMRSDMATKEDIRGLKLEIDGLKSAVRETREDVRNLNGIMISKADLDPIRDDIRELKDARRVDELETRVKRIEHKLDTSRTRRAA